MDWGLLQGFFRSGEGLKPGTLLLMLASALIVLLVNMWGKAVLGFLSRPFRWMWHALYMRFAPRMPNVALRAYRRHVKSAFAHLETPVAPSVEVPHRRAFTPLRLLSAEGRKQLELFSFVKETRRFVLLGGPGTGKTTLMKGLVLSILMAEEGAPAGVHPVLVVLRHLASKEQSIEDAIVDVFNRHHFPGAARFIRAALEQGKMLIILDGLDELGEDRGAVVRQILEFCARQEGTDNRLIVTCRESSYVDQELRGAIAHVVRVEPFSNRNIREFLIGWPVHEGRHALSLYPILQQDPQIRDICRNPLLLTLLVGIYLDEGSEFELPRARNQFYDKLLNELFVQRSKRKTLPKEQFSKEDKSKLLERVSLAQLEAPAGRVRDPEAFSTEILAATALDVLKRPVDCEALVRELVDRDGIVKRAGENLTLAHRTIQEYLGAREARRHRQYHDLLRLCEFRADLWQLFYFYCGRLDNVSEIEAVLKELCERGVWHQAGRVLTYITEAVDVQIVDRITAKLEKPPQGTAELGRNSELEVLASIAQRPGVAFEGARRAFDKAIEDLLASPRPGSVSALETVLAASPEMALPVCRRLLENRDLARKAGGLRLLGEIDTPEALDELVGLLADGDNLVRAMAATALLPVAFSRAADMRRLQRLLPKRKDPTTWPLEPYFPSNIALALVEAHAGHESTVARDVAVPDVFRHALRVRRLRERWSLREWCFSILWRGQVYCLRFVRWWLRVRGRVILTIGTLAIAMAGALALASEWAARNGVVITLRTRAPFVAPHDCGALDEIRSVARSTLVQVNRRFSPNVQGAARLLPWNWSPSPASPATVAATYPILQYVAEGPSGAGLAAVDSELVSVVALVESPAVVLRLREAIRRLDWPQNLVAEIAPTATWWWLLLAWAPITIMSALGRRRMAEDPFAAPPQQLAVELVYLPLLVLLQGSALLALFRAPRLHELTTDTPAASLVKVVVVCAPALVIQLVQRGFDRSPLWRQLWTFSAKCLIEPPRVPRSTSAT